MKRIPYEEEIRLCDFLISYLESKFLNSQVAIQEPVAVDATVFKFKGMSLRARSDEDYVVLGNASKKGKKKGGGGNTKDKIIHSVDTITSFSSLDINYPMTPADVPDVLVLLREKKTFYQTQPRGAVPTLASKQKVEVDRDVKAPEKQKKKDFTADNNTDFPSL